MKNTGNVPMNFGSFIDPRCDSGTITRGTSPVAPGAGITYTCRHLVTEADQAAGSSTSTASLTGTPPEGDGKASTRASNTLVANVPSPSFTIEDLQQVAGAGSFTSSPLTAPVGETVAYEMLVKNTGNVELTLGGFSDQYCDEGTVSGSTAAVAPGGTATIVCSHVVQLGRPHRGRLLERGHRDRHTARRRRRRHPRTPPTRSASPYRPSRSRSKRCSRCPAAPTRPPLSRSPSARS